MANRPTCTHATGTRRPRDLIVELDEKRHLESIGQSVEHLTLEAESRHERQRNGAGRDEEESTVLLVGG
jgi:hypothetical protein